MIRTTTPNHFVHNVAPTLLQQIGINTSAIWGKMTPQHMIEHLQQSLWMSTGCGNSSLMVSRKKLPKQRAILLSNQSFPKQVKVSRFSKRLQPLRYDNIEKAKNQLLLAINYFYFYHKNKNIKEHMHPLFGELNFEEWEWFHYKHFVHHFTQFGLVKSNYKIGNFISSFENNQEQRMVA